MRSSAAGEITVVLKKCGPGSLSVKTTPAYAKEFKRRLSSASSLTVHLSPDGKGRGLLRKKKHPRVTIQLTLIATSGSQPGSVVTRTGTATIGVNGSRLVEEKRAAEQQVKEAATAAQEAEAAARRKRKKKPLPSRRLKRKLPPRSRPKRKPLGRKPKQKPLRRRPQK